MTRIAYAYGPASDLRKVGALIRGAFLSAASYRLRMLLSFVGLVVTLIPLFFVADALQPMVAASIRQEGEQYFGFLLVGIATLGFVAFGLSSVESPISSGISTGTLEALLATPTPLPVLLAGMAGFDFIRAVAKTLLLLAALLVVGTPVFWGSLPLSLLILALIMLAYVGIGLVAAALHLAFRTSGPLTTGALTLSMLLGGAYFSTTVVPGVIRPLTAVVPLTYGLRALRQSLLQGVGFTEVATDVGILTGLAVLFLGIGVLTFRAAIRHARRTGTLIQY